MAPLGVFVLVTFLGSCGVLATSPLTHTPPTRFTEYPEGRPPRDPPQLSRFRLPTDVIPRHYDLRIRPILTNTTGEIFSAPGHVTITLECMTPTNDIVLHADELEINDTSITVTPQGSTTPLAITAITPDATNQALTISVATPLTLGARYDLSISYKAIIAAPNVRTNGIYWSSYVETDGSTAYLATTQFSRTRSFRKTLPSYDEPTHKATFTITIGRQEALHHSLSNMDINRTTPIDGMPGWVWDIYNPTPVMPATVIAMIVSSYQETAAPAGLYGKPVKIWAPPPLMANGEAEFAADSVAKQIEFLETYFNITYELPKIDSAAIPDFAAGAMENWGLNTYRLALLLWSPLVNTQAQKFSIGNVIGHELTHQWWGNLVTHTWWNDWWLTEGFASYYEYLSFADSNPEFDPMGRQVTSDLQPAMTFDISDASGPIHGNFTEYYDEVPTTITYSKGSCLVKMMEAFLTEPVFNAATKFYLKKRAYTAVDQDDLFNDLTEFLEANEPTRLPNGFSMKTVMDSWTLQTGFPLVRISKAGDNTIYVSQEEFLRSGANGGQKTWHVPVSWAREGAPDFTGVENLTPKMWLDAGEILKSARFDTNQWIVVNNDARNYYRVLYDSHFEGKLVQLLSSTPEVVSSSSRSQLVDDYFTAAYEEYIPLERALSLSDAFIKAETDYNVWVPYLKHLRTGFTLFGNLNDTVMAPLKAHLLGAMEKVIGEIGVSQEVGESPVSTISRVLLLDYACALGLAECVAYAGLTLDAWKAETGNVNPVPVDLRAILYCAVVAADRSEDDWNFVRRKWKETGDISLRNALRCSQNATKIQSLIDEVIAGNGTEVTPAEAYVYLSVLVTAKTSRDLVVASLRTRLNELVATTGNVTGLAEVFSSMTSMVSDPAEIATLESLIADNAALVAPIEAQLTSALVSMRRNAAWMDKFGWKLWELLSST